MPRAFLVKKRSPRRGSVATADSGKPSNVSGSEEHSKMTLSPSIQWAPACTATFKSKMDLEKEKTLRSSVISSHGDLQNDGDYITIPISQSPYHKGGLLQNSPQGPPRFDDENKDPQESKGERSEIPDIKEVRYAGIDFTPPQGIVPAEPAASSHQMLGKNSPESALEPEKMSTHISPTAPSSGSLRAIGYITPTLGGPKITIEKTPGPNFYLTPHSPSHAPNLTSDNFPSNHVARSGQRPSSPQRSNLLLRSRSPLRPRSPDQRKSSGRQYSPGRSRSPLKSYTSALPCRSDTRPTLWAPHREIERSDHLIKPQKMCGTDDIKLESRVDDNKPYRIISSPPSYYNVLNFSPDLPQHFEGRNISPERQLRPYSHRDAENIHPHHKMAFPYSNHYQPQEIQLYRDRISPDHATTYQVKSQNSFTSGSPPSMTMNRAPLQVRGRSPPTPHIVRYDSKSSLETKYEHRQHDYAIQDISYTNQPYSHVNETVPGNKAWDRENYSDKQNRNKAPWGSENIPMYVDDLVRDAPKKSRENDPPRFQCDACKKSYATHGGLSKHKQFHCTVTIKKEFCCKYCPKTYVSLGALKMHIRTHTLPCKCHLCGKAFSRPWLLQGHMRTHTGEKPFQCSHCGRSFADRSNLRAHLQTHTDIKKYSCRNCSKSFSRNSLLLKHEDGGCSLSI